MQTAVESKHSANAETYVQVIGEFEPNSIVVKHDATSLDEQMATKLSNDTRAVRTAIADLQRMAQQSEEWAGNELAASHRRLYAILTDCYRYYLRMKTDTSGQVRADLKKALDTFLIVKIGGDGDKGKHDMNRIVKAVFGADRRRVSAYGIALRSALEAGGKDSSGKVKPLAADRLADWLTEKGGVEEVRLGGKKGLSVAERSDIAKRAVDNRVITTYKPDPRAIDMDTDDNDKMIVLVATYRPTGEFEINAVVRADGAVNAALAAHYSADKEGVRAAAEKATTPKGPASAMDVAVAVIPAAA